MSSFHPSRRHGWRNPQWRQRGPPTIVVPLYPTYNGGWAPYGMPGPRWCPPSRQSNSHRRGDRSRDRSDRSHRDRRASNNSRDSSSAQERNRTFDLNELERFADDDKQCIHISDFSKLRRDFPEIDPDLFHDIFWVAEGRSARQAVQSIRKALRRVRFARNRTSEIFRTRYDFLREKFIARYGIHSWRRVPCSTAESALFDNTVKQAVLAVRMQYFATQSDIIQFYEEITWIEEQSRVITQKQQKMRSSDFLSQCPKAKFCKDKHGCQKCWIWDHGNDLMDGEDIRILPCGHMCHDECVETLIKHASKEKKAPRCGICGKDIPDHACSPAASPAADASSSAGSDSPSTSASPEADVDTETQLPEATPDEGSAGEDTDGPTPSPENSPSFGPMSSDSTEEDRQDLSLNEMLAGNAALAYENDSEFEGEYEEPDEGNGGSESDDLGTTDSDSQEEMHIYEEPCEDHIPEEILYY